MFVTASHDLELRIDRADRHTTLAVTGELDYGTVARLRAALLELVHEDADEVVVDLGEVTFIDSTGLSVLVQAKQRFDKVGRRMSVSQPQPRVVRVLQLAGLSDYLVGG